MTTALAAAGVVLALAVNAWLRRAGQRWGSFVVPALFLALVGWMAWRGSLDGWQDAARALGGLVLVLTTWVMWGLEPPGSDTAAEQGDESDPARGGLPG